MVEFYGGMRMKVNTRFLLTAVLLLAVLGTFCLAQEVGSETAEVNTEGATGVVLTEETITTADTGDVTPAEATIDSRGYGNQLHRSNTGRFEHRNP
jgi:hypothetical protein